MGEYFSPLLVRSRTFEYQIPRSGPSLAHALT
jgi:hypothetical protein